MGGQHDQNERREITEKICDKETRMLGKTRKATAKIRGLSEEISEKGRGKRAVGENANNREQWKNNNTGRDE